MASRGGGAGSPPPRRTGKTAGGLRFRDELGDFFRFLRHPRFGPRLYGPRHGSGWWADWFPPLSLWRLLQWAAWLWFFNLVIWGPLAVVAAGAGGATHRLDLNNVPWLQALLWAPVVEELVFRYGLRRPGVAWWLVPVSIAIMLTGPKWPALLMLAGVILLCWWPYLSPRAPAWATRCWPWRYRVFYRRCFPALFYLASLLFAAVHLYNFKLHQTPWWVLPILVAPQFATGLVLGWVRIRRGIGASMLLHCIFNGGPLLVVWIIIRYMPEMVT
ncbi:CPBP family intramembrane metalloprotease [Allopusillimonas ginsengisoli]|nr:CPBP family intramembrane metalloprotease [Allopusillimonas ginsengisoli]